MKATTCQFEVHQANQGDSLLLSLSYPKGRNKHIMIDGGTSSTYNHDPSGLYKRLDQIESKGEHIDLLIITHYDADHIGGVLKMYEEGRYGKEFVKKIWFNSGEDYPIPFHPPGVTRMGAKQGYSLQKYLKEIGDWNGESLITRFADCKEVEEDLGVRMEILSPDPEHMPKLQKDWAHKLKDEKTRVGIARKRKDWDYAMPLEELVEQPFEQDESVTNGSSIAMLLEVAGKRLLLLGDAFADTIVDSLTSLGYSPEKRLKLDIFKVSHHGSRGNTNEALLDLVECRNFIISTSGSSYRHPDKECLARIVMDHVRKGKENELFFYFNYSRKEYFDILKVDGEDSARKKYNFDILIKEGLGPWVFEFSEEN